MCYWRPRREDSRTSPLTDLTIRRAKRCVRAFMTCDFLKSFLLLNRFQTSSVSMTVTHLGYKYRVVLSTGK